MLFYSSIRTNKYVFCNSVFYRIRSILKEKKMEVKIEINKNRSSLSLNVVHGPLRLVLTAPWSFTVLTILLKALMQHCCAAH